MKIGLLTACYKPVINGVTRMVMLYANHLKEMGHEPTIFTLGPANEEDEPYVIRSNGRMLGDSGYYGATGYSEEAKQRLQQMDILHAHHLWMSLDFAQRYARTDQPIIYTNHTRYDIYAGEYIPLLPKSITRPFGRAIMRWMWPRQTKRCTAVISPSAHVQEIMEAYGVTSPIHTISNGIQRDLFTNPASPRSKAGFDIAQDHPTAVYVGRLASEKRILTLLEAFATAKAQIPELQLQLIGSGPQKEEIEQAIKAHQLENNVSLLGWIPYEQIGNCLAAADFFVTASASEVHPLTAIEAMAAGLPIVAPPALWVTDTLPSTAVLATNQLNEGIVTLAKNSVLRQEMSQAARHASEAYDIRNTVILTIELYEKLINC